MRTTLLATLLVLTACASGPTEESTVSSEALTAAPTKTELTANNTSASSLFRDLYTPASRFNGAAISVVSNGDNPTSATAASTLADGAVSKLSLHGLLPAAPNAKVFFETQSWFCTDGASPLASSLGTDQCSDHIDIGYGTSSRVPMQVADMRSRGADGVIVDWHGRGSGENQSALAAFKTAAEGTRGKFQLAVMEDEGVKACAEQAGCDVAQTVLADIAYLAASYFPSSAYYRVNERPVLFFFGIDGYVSANGKPPVDWGYIRAHAAGNPLFVFQGYEHDQADGNYAWPTPTAIASYPGKDPFGASNLRDFYAQAQAPFVFGSGYKGFDDHVVNAWKPIGVNAQRYLGQQCGKTWLDTFALANAHSGLTALQVATWDDYEEGTETETGIANHLAITPHVSGTLLDWTLVGAADAPADCKEALAGGFDIATTVDHFAVYASTDGEHMTLLVDNLAASARSFDIAGKTGMFYVRAVGKPSITNTLSAPVTTGATPPPPGCTGVPTILEPTSNGKVGPAIRLRATAPGCLQTMIAYIDGKPVAQVDAAAIDQWIPVSMGAHTVNVNAWAGTSEAHLSAPVSFVRTY